MSFLSLLCCSLLSISSGGMGSPEQVWGCALWAGRPGPFFVLSSFRHLARLFWNQTWKTKMGMNFSLIYKSIGEISRSIESITVKFSLAYCVLRWLFQTVVECIFCGAKIQWFTAILSNWSLVFRPASPPLYWLPNKIQVQHYYTGGVNIGNNMDHNFPIVYTQ